MQKPLRPIWMCEHMVVRSFNRRGDRHHYGACQLGDADARVLKGRQVTRRAKP